MATQPTYGAYPDNLPIGTVLCATEEPYEDPNEIYVTIPCTKVADTALDKAVFGVFAGWAVEEHELYKHDWETTLELRPWLEDRLVSTRTEEADRVIVKLKSARVVTAGTCEVLVTGSCEIGDLLTTSDIYGVAIVAPEGTDSRYILGKALTNKANIGVSLVCCSI